MSIKRSQLPDKQTLLGGQMPSNRIRNNFRSLTFFCIFFLDSNNFYS